jgi:hypothetical protein
MIPIASMAELWHLTNNKKRGDTSAVNVGPGKLFFSISSCQVESDDHKHAGATSPALQLNYSQGDHPTPAKLPSKKYASSSTQRRTPSWSADIKEEADAFIRKLYDSVDSNLYHGFHFGCASIMSGHFLNNQKYGKEKDAYIWEVFLCTPGNPQTWPEYDDLRIDFTRSVYDRVTKGVLPERDAFPLSIENPGEPPQVPDDL